MSIRVISKEEAEQIYPNQVEDPDFRSKIVAIVASVKDKTVFCGYPYLAEMLLLNGKYSFFSREGIKRKKDIEGYSKALQRNPDVVRIAGAIDFDQLPSDIEPGDCIVWATSNDKLALFGDGIEDSIQQQELLNSPTSATGVLTPELIDSAIEANQMNFKPKTDNYPQSKLFANPETLVDAETAIQFDNTGKPSTITTMADWPKNITVYEAVKRICDETGNDYHQYVQQLKRMANDPSNAQKAFQAKRVLRKLQASKPKAKQRRKRFNGARKYR